MTCPQRFEKVSQGIDREHSFLVAQWHYCVHPVTFHVWMIALNTRIAGLSGNSLGHGVGDGWCLRTRSKM